MCWSLSNKQLFPKSIDRCTHCYLELEVYHFWMIVGVGVVVGVFEGVLVFVGVIVWEYVEVSEAVGDGVGEGDEVGVKVVHLVNGM